jgi:hypothetical protein
MGGRSGHSIGSCWRHSHVDRMLQTTCADRIRNAAIRRRPDGTAYTGDSRITLLSFRA